MKLSKTTIMIISAVIIIAAIYFLFFYKKAPAAVVVVPPAGGESNFGNFIVPGVPAFGKNTPAPTVGKVKAASGSEISNTKARCPQGSHQTTFSDGSQGCIQNVA